MCHGQPRLKGGCVLYELCVRSYKVIPLASQAGILQRFRILISVFTKYRAAEQLEYLLHDSILM